MSKTSTIGETQKRVLSGSDAMGMCFLYPSASRASFATIHDHAGAAASDSGDQLSLDDGCARLIRRCRRVVGRFPCLRRGLKRRGRHYPLIAAGDAPQQSTNRDRSGSGMTEG